MLSSEHAIRRSKAVVSQMAACSASGVDATAGLRLSVGYAWGAAL